MIGSRASHAAGASHRIAIGVTALALALGCSAADDPAVPVQPPPPTVGPDRVLAAHVLSRAGYGPDAWSLARVEQLGIGGYIDEQLAPSTIDDGELEAMLAPYTTLDMEVHDLIDAHGGPGGMPFLPVFELMQARLLSAVHSRRQLERVLIDFWFDHFNVYALDGFTNFAVAPYERDAIRPHVLGRFEDMLRAVAGHPAMLYYLDNYLSSRQGFEFEGEIRGLNENYARELLELHTVGVDGGYDQQDVIEVARAFTGWTIAPRAVAGADAAYYWNAAHDQGAKHVMGELDIAPFGGERDGREVIAYLAAHPSTARFLCGRLTERFVDEQAPGALVDRCANVYLSSHGDLREVLRTLLHSAEFLDVGRAGGKVKRPFVLAASLARTTGIDLGNDELRQGLVYLVGQLGEPLYQAHPPTGFPDVSTYWASGGTLVSRFNLVSLLTSLDLALGIDWGVEDGSATEIVDAVTTKVLPGGISGTTRSAAIAHVSSMDFAPAPLRVREAAALVLSSPDYMRH